jgi:hypothetical protein
VPPNITNTFLLLGGRSARELHLLTLSLSYSLYQGQVTKENKENTISLFILSHDFQETYLYGWEQDEEVIV